ncbi:11224_t:CDS:2 [Dentiscutata erythropus]|uniref:11224_t:CDS:1 n=1 Tax=Dentiscutata erythropus TaxID=1348616 RepID=A0A9N9GDA3_9GLOM|nr:11224_t:CDS:2 [Dentiscutata erythropus]
MTKETSDHFHHVNNMIASWFFGPRAENKEFVKEFYDNVIDLQAEGRMLYFDSADPNFITTQMQNSKEFKNNIEYLRSQLNKLLEKLNERTVPFWSPRYMGHMVTETTMPSNLGYVAALQYNQNNIASEGAPLTTMLEIGVGNQLCEMLGFDTSNNLNINLDNLDKEDESIYNFGSQEIQSWGHITCDARNLKFYPLSLRLAIEEGRLSFIDKSFTIELANGSVKLFKDCTTWELLNFKPTTVLNIPERLYQKYGITSQFLQASLNDYTIQTVGKDYLEQKFGITKPSLYFASSTHHYSWPKGCAIVGIGSKNLKSIPVDNAARMDVNELDKVLAKCVRNKQAVYAVVAIMGSTEQGACDPLADIVALRERYQRRYGLSFVIHADAAWGGYFRTMLIEPPKNSPCGDYSENYSEERDTFVPMLALNPYTRKHLYSLKDCDSITIDPHKSGYIPYPAGSLCYRDQRMRYLVTWTSPVVTRSKEESIGIYGVEGSKPGAAPVAAWLSHDVIGLHQKGYGALLGQATFTCSKIYCHWATMSTDKDNFIVVPFNMLPAEKLNPPNLEEVKEQKQKIRELIVTKSNLEIINNEEALNLIKKVGSDLIINTFACNFKVDGKVNENIGEANYLNRRLFEKFSLTSYRQDNKTKPLILTSTTLKQSSYGHCLTNFKNRLGLKGDQDLYVLINVVMSPWPTEFDFITTLTKTFKETLKELTELSARRNTKTPVHLNRILSVEENQSNEKICDYTSHLFVIQGTDEIYLVHLPIFQLETHRQQVIIKAEMSTKMMEKYKDFRKKDPSKMLILCYQENITIDQIAAEGSSFSAYIIEGFDPYMALTERHKMFSRSSRSFKIKTTKLLKMRKLGSSYQDAEYPIDRVPFYIYGTENQLHIDHLLLKSPSIQLSAESVQIELTSGNFTKEQKERGAIVHIIAKEEEDGTIVDLYEVAMQPFPDTKYLGNSFFFRANTHFHVELYEDPVCDPALNGPGLDNVNSISPFAIGKIILPSVSKGSLYIDSHLINIDPVVKIQKGRTVKRASTEWRKCPKPLLANTKKNWYEKDDFKTSPVRASFHSTL